MDNTIADFINEAKRSHGNITAYELLIHGRYPINPLYLVLLLIAFLIKNK